MGDQGSIASGANGARTGGSVRCEQEHRYIQHLVKGLGQERGFGASLDEPILDGRVKVDISLVRSGQKIACEICLTAFHDDRLRKIEGYIEAKYSDIVLIGRTERDVKKQAGLIKGKLREGYCARITCTAADRLVEHLDDLVKADAVGEFVCGYKVKSKFKEITPEEMARRRAEIAAVIARSIGRMQKRGDD